MRLLRSPMYLKMHALNGAYMNIGSSPNTSNKWRKSYGPFGMFVAIVLQSHPRYSEFALT